MKPDIRHAYDIITVMIATARFTGFDATTLHGMAAALENDDHQAAIKLMDDMASTHGVECHACLKILRRAMEDQLCPAE